jgi:transposase
MTLEEAMARIGELEAQLKAALDRIAELEREKARQAGPFRRREPLKVPPAEKKTPGRKPGHPGAYRQRPRHFDETDVVPLDQCPHCQGAVEVEQWHTQFIEEIVQVRPHVRRIVTFTGRCKRCGSVRSTHPEQTSRAQGVAGVTLGRRAQALAILLNKHVGIPLRKTCQILRQGFGLSLTSGGLSQLIQRAACKVKGQYEQLIEQLRASDVVYADETSWYVGGPGHWLWVFTTPTSTVYRVASSRGHPVAAKVLGSHFPGVLVSDCAQIYDKFPGPQHKCIFHHLQAIERNRQLPKMKNPRYLDAWERLWKEVIELTKQRAALAPAEFAARTTTLEAQADAFLAEEPAQLGDRKFRTRMKNARKHLFGCLHYPVDPTNNRAERAIRPAVVARKISCGNKTERGASASEILMSLAATTHQQARDFLTHLAQSLTLQPELAG